MLSLLAAGGWFAWANKQQQRQQQQRQQQQRQQQQRSRSSSSASRAKADQRMWPPRQRLPSRLLLVVVGLLAPHTLNEPVTAMLFVPSPRLGAGGTAYGLWDQTGLVAPDGTWRMWYDAQGPACNLTSGSALCGFGLATSRDGVQWHDEGMNMRPFDEPSLGSGAVWRSPSDPDEWVINYSDGCSVPSSGGQHIRFQTSRNSSLRGPWTPRRDVPPFAPSVPLGYRNPGRWDTINPYFDTESKTLYGWWTASLPTDGPGGPGKAGKSAMGFGKSEDGVHWQALPPALLTWPSTTSVTAAGFEIGGVAPITSGGRRRWYASVCMSHQELPAAIDGKVGCFTFVAEQPGGPYTIAAKNAAILGYGQRGHNPEYSYYHRFFHAPCGVLLTHYQVYDKAHWKQEPDVTVYLSVLKRLAVNPADGALRMMWWEANEALKMNKSSTFGPIAGSTVTLDVRSGSIVEGSIAWGADGGLCFPYASGTRPGTDFVAGLIGVNRTHVLTAESTSATCASMTINDTLGVTDRAPEPSRGLRLRDGAAVAFRLMFRRGMFDLYLQDALILSYALAAGGKPYAKMQEARLVGNWEGAAGVTSWRMNLPATDDGRQGSISRPQPKSDELTPVSQS